MHYGRASTRRAARRVEWGALMNLLGKGSVAWWIKLILDVAWFALLAIFVLLTLVAVVGALKPGGTDHQIEMGVRIEPDETQYKIAAPEWGVADAKVVEAQGKVRFKNPGGAHAAALMAWSNAMLFIALFSVYHLRRIFKALAAGEPFDPANASRIRWIGLALIATQPMGFLMRLAFARQVQDAFHAEGIKIAPAWGFNLVVVLFGLMLIVIAEAFRIGAEMKKEQDLTI